MKPKKNDNYKQYLKIGAVLVFIFILVIFALTKSNPNLFATLIPSDKDYFVEFEEVQLTDELHENNAGTCWFFTDFPFPTEKVIRTQNEYNSYLAETDSSCLDSQYFRQFDFNKYTLLGQFAVGGCSADFNKEVTRNDRQRKVNYHIEVKSSGNCAAGSTNHNWILIPSIPENYTVNFEVSGI